MQQTTMMQNLAYTMGTLLRDMRQTLDKRLKVYDLTRYEWMIIALLQYHQGEVTQAALRDYIGIDDSYLTKVLDKLTEKHIITKVVNSEDRRGRVIKINSANGDLVQGVYHQLQLFNEQLLSVVSPEGHEALFSMLERIHTKIRTHC